MKKLALLFLLALCARAAAETYTSPELGFTFPATLAGMKLVETTDFEQEQKGLGTGISYRGEAEKADFYIYNLGQPSLPAGVSSPLIKQHFDQVKNEVMIMEKKGYYNNVAFPIPSETVSIGNLEFLHSEMSYDESGTPCVSHLYLTVFKDQFFKIRYTMKADGRDPVKSLQKFLEALAPVLTAKNSF